jgi:iron complex transport system ATP-binding protein
LKLQVENVWFKYHTMQVLKGISFDLVPAELLCLVGPNGSGKSTLIRCIDDILRPQRGRIRLDAIDTNAMHRQELARRMGYVPQGTQQAFSTTVFDTVLMGRRPHASWRSCEKDTDKVIEVLQILGLDGLAMQDCNELSGGQLQRVMIARALAQEPDILLLDESTSALDICHQLEVMETLLTLVRSKNIAAIMAMHDLNMASRYADRVLMLKEGYVYTEGPPVDIFTAENIAHVYNVNASVRIDHDGKPSIVPINRIGNNSEKMEKLVNVAVGEQIRNI